ncbi:hypothetical protein MSIMFI_04866 [Mycobacterium simulans]|nr:hypothetical protein MSIMFI_04866 [Mycobacterium simulans]
MVGHIGRERFGYGRGINPVRNGSGSDEAHDGCTLRVAAEHHLRLGTTAGHGNHMGASVSNTVDAGGPLLTGWVVDRIDPQRLCANAWTKGVDECLPGRANARRLTGATGKHHLHIGARLGGRGWDSEDRKNGGAEAPRCG